MYHPVSYLYYVGMVLIGLINLGVFMPELIGGIARTLLATAGGSLIAKGYINNADIDSLVGAVTVLVTLGWSMIQKYRASLIAK